MYMESSQNPRFKAWKKLLTKKGRSQQQQFIVEGFHLAEEAFRSKWPIDAVIVADHTDIPPSLRVFLNVHLINTYTVTSRLFAELSETQSPQGIILIIKKKTQETLEQLCQRGNFLLLVDQVQDPGNLGTMIRTADAAGIDGIILGNGTVDAYSGKVLRSTQGSIFHISLMERALEDCIDQLKKESWLILGTSLSAAEDYRAISLQQGQKVALIVGNEGQGISDSILQLAAKRIKIPIWGLAESLNVGVATGILLYHLKSQQHPLLHPNNR